MRKELVESDEVEETCSKRCESMDEETNGSEEKKGLSKNQMKKRARRELYKRKKEERTEWMRQKKKEVQRLKRQKREECGVVGGDRSRDKHVGGDDSSPKISRAERRRQGINLDKQLFSKNAVMEDGVVHFYCGASCVVEFLSKCGSSPTVIIDCMFEGLQTESELTSLSQQLMFAYGLNRNSETPFKLIICGISPELQTCLERISGYNNWTCDKYSTGCDQLFNFKRIDPSKDNQQHDDSVLVKSNGYKDLSDGYYESYNHNNVAFQVVEISEGVNRRDDSHLERHQREFIYLTADSNNVIENLNPNNVYIIGGLVDRNRYPGLTAQRAEDWNVKTARLPIQDHYTLSGSKVLTVNQVFEILSHFMGLNNWKDAIRAAIPSRKILRVISQ